MAKAAGKKKHILRNILICLLIVAILLGIGIKVVLNKLNVDYPVLSSDYEIGQWYKVSPEGAR